MVTVAYRYLQTSTDVALSSGDPTVAAPGYLYAGGEQVKPTNPPATFDELQERMEALDELANMTDQESSYTTTIFSNHLSGRVLRSVGCVCVCVSLCVHLAKFG